jgi:Flp pilus assembly CpaE family ATPase
MNKTSVRVLLIEDNPDYAELVQQWLASAGDDAKFDLSWTDTLAGGLNRIAQGDMDVILLDLGLPDSHGMETYAAVKARALGVPTIILSAADSESLAIEMVHHGAQDYLVKGSCTADALVRAVRFAIARHSVQARTTRAEAIDQTRFLGVVGAKGGVGSTTVACTLLRRQTNQKVLLVDLDVSTSFGAFLMGVHPQFSMLDAISNLHRLDFTCWKSIVSDAGSDLDMIPLTTEYCTDPAPDDIRKVLTSIQPHYQWIVLDFGRLNGVFMALVDRLSDILIVTSPTLPSLYGSKRVVDEMTRAGVDRERLRLIVNQAEDTLALSGNELQMVFGIPVFGRLPRDTQELHNACVQRRLPAESSDIRKHAANLARRIVGLNEEKSGWKIPQLWSFMGRFRKPASPNLVGEAVNRAEK